jgi:DNA-binding Lrp family transcriptional regulator
MIQSPVKAISWRSGLRVGAGSPWSLHKLKTMIHFMKSPAPSLAPILRSDTQGRILAALLIDSTRELSLTELAKLTGASVPTVIREIDRAETAQIVKSRRVGSARLVRADTTHPLHRPLTQLITATYGPPAIIADALGKISEIDRLYLIGSWAARYLGQPGPAPHDIDVLVVGRPDRNLVYDAADDAERRLGVPVQVVFRTPEQWIATNDPFITEVRSRPLMLVLGRKDDDG